MSDNDHKADLLNKLVIDKSEPEDDPTPLYKNPFLLSGVALVVGLGLGALLFHSSAPAPQTAESMPAADAAPMVAEGESEARDTGDEILDASGYVTARVMATVSSEVMGRLETVEVDEGSVVKEGQVLARLDDAIPRVSWELAKAQYASQKARLENTRTQYNESLRVLKRQELLSKQGLTSEAQLTQAQAQAEGLASSIKSAEADLEVARLQVQHQRELLDDYVVHAPFSGVVTVKAAQPGEIVAPSSAGGGFTRTGICTIVDMDSLEIEVDVNESFIGRVFPGQKVVAHLDAYPDWDIAASVIAVIPTADRSKATVQVRIRILDKDPKILPDMGAKVTFYKDAADSTATGA